MGREREGRGEENRAALHRKVDNNKMITREAETTGQSTSALA